MACELSRGSWGESAFEHVAKLAAQIPSAQSIPDDRLSVRSAGAKGRCVSVSKATQQSHHALYVTMIDVPPSAFLNDKVANV